ncbi:MAG TPA: BlaI/MecI/CopY family transcriptional regulator [Bacteroidetes bacterium]|nr:BlaI/MecI/CopY family transcriptional regulator [Bacteroidota bacterium]
MSKKQLPKPTESELSILKVLWENGPSSVRFVNERLNEKKETGYTTTLKFMQIMLQKGLLTRNTDSRSHVYQPAIDQEITQLSLLDKFVDNVFGGSATSLVMQALGNHGASKEELKKIKALIKKIEKEERK